MTHPRLSTVFDYADLRLHPDGTRVYQKPSNFRPGIIKVAVQNSRTNWIARDAGGSGKIHKMRPRGKVKETGASQEPEGQNAGVLAAEVEEEIEEDVEVDEESDEQGKSSKETKKRKAKPVDKRKAKRQKFAADYDYLLPKISGPNEVETCIADDSINDVKSLPEPSPDLLKCIHRFAAEFYTERGQLLNISREYRKERKKRAQKRAQKRLRASRKEEGLGSSSGSSSSQSSKSKEDSGDPASNVETEQDDDDDDGEEAELDSDDRGEGPSTSRNMKKKGNAKRKGRRRAGKLYTDMYKMFDGSSMMALGMLVQEHIAHLLTPQVPPGWDEEMRNFFDSQRSEEGTLQTGLAATDSEENEGFEAADDADLSHKADEDEDDSEGEEAEDEQTPPSNGNIKKRERGQGSPVSDDGISQSSHSTSEKPSSKRPSSQLNADDNHLQTSSDESLPSEPMVDSEED